MLPLALDLDKLKAAAEAEEKNDPEASAGSEVHSDIYEQSEELFVNNRLSEDALKYLTQNDSLFDVKSLTLRVNTEGRSLDDLGEFLPNLRTLQLDQSYITSFRDLGPRYLRNLRVLKMAKCGVVDIDGVEYLEALEELYLPFNQIENMEPLMMHPSLRLLDVYSNKIRNTSAIEFLASAPNLTTVTLDFNPISTFQHYRNIISCRIPQLKILDGCPVTSEEQKQFTAAEEKIIDADKVKRVNEQDNEFSVIPEISNPAPTLLQNRGSTVSSQAFTTSANGALPSTRGGHSETASSISSSGTSSSRPQTARSSRGMWELGATEDTYESWRNPSVAPSSSHSTSTNSEKKQKGEVDLYKHLDPTADDKNDINDNDDAPLESASDLTYGSKISLGGSFASALRNRRKNNPKLQQRMPKLPADESGSEAASPTSPASTTNTSLDSSGTSFTFEKENNNINSNMYEPYGKQSRVEITNCSIGGNELKEQDDDEVMPIVFDVSRGGKPKLHSKAPPKRPKNKRKSRRDILSSATVSSASSSSSTSPSLSLSSSSSSSSSTSPSYGTSSEKEPSFSVSPTASNASIDIANFLARRQQRRSQKDVGSASQPRSTHQRNEMQQLGAPHNGMQMQNPQGSRFRPTPPQKRPSQRPPSARTRGLLDGTTLPQMPQKVIDAATGAKRPSTPSRPRSASRRRANSSNKGLSDF